MKSGVMESLRQSEVGVELAATRRFKTRGKTLKDNTRFGFSVVRDVPWMLLGTYLHQLSPPRGKSQRYELPVSYPLILIRVPADGQARTTISLSHAWLRGVKPSQHSANFRYRSLCFPLSDRRISCSLAVISA
jgi:hypothetical protein